MAAFAPHEALDCAVTRAGSRSYAFVLFRSVAESRAALEALRGSKVKGAFIRVEFARPVTSHPPPSSFPHSDPLPPWIPPGSGCSAM